MVPAMKTFFFAVTAALSLAACGGEMNTNMTCTQNYSCMNNACTCSDAPKQGQTCCSPSDSTCTTNKCDTFCRICM